jgi:restriction system protein
MARRKKSDAETVIDLFALMPWWACVALAAVAYVALHALASKAPATVDPTQALNQMDKLLVGAALRGLATFGQYLVPVLLLAAAAVSAVRRYRRGKLLEEAVRSQDAAAVDGMTWHEFEVLIGEAFRRKGYAVVETGGGGPDGGIDLMLRKPVTNGNETYVVQCKHWKAQKVGVDVVRELYGVMAARGAAGGFVVTSGRFTTEAMAFAQGRNVRLVDGARLKELLEVARTGGPGKAATVRDEQANAEMTMVVCPLCSSAMVRRVAKRGPNAGEQFYGCSTYPVCRGTRAA